MSAPAIKTTETASDSPPPLHYDSTQAPKPSWLGYLWDTADVSAQERRLLFKVDASLLLFASVGRLDFFF
jgi:hypothetical protein